MSNVPENQWQPRALPPSAPTVQPPAPSSDFKIPSSLLGRAKANDTAAIKLMFAQFVPPDEVLLAAEYLGVQGLWWVGRHSFACLSNRRICSIMIGPWGEVVYQDAVLEDNNSGIIYQPGLLGLYVTSIVFVLFSLFLTFGLLLIFFPYVVQYYYRINKCGLVWVIKEGVSVYLFCNRGKLSKANQLYRLAAAQRVQLLKERDYRVV